MSRRPGVYVEYWIIALIVVGVAAFAMWNFRPR